MANKWAIIISGIFSNAVKTLLLMHWWNFFCDTISAANITKFRRISPNLRVKPIYTISSFRKRWIWPLVPGSPFKKGLFRISSLIIYLLLSPELHGHINCLTWSNKNTTLFLIFYISLSDWNRSFNNERFLLILAMTIFFVVSTTSEMYLKPSRKATMELYCENTEQLKVVNRFSKKLHCRCLTEF